MYLKVCIAGILKLFVNYRKVVWKHILNVYPEGMTGKQRMDYIKRKANEYYTLKARWKDCIHKGMVGSIKIAIIL